MTALALPLALALSVSGASGGDYALDPDAWNGIGYLLETGKEAKVEVEVVEQLDFGALRPDDVLLWLYPARPLPTDELLAFLEDGGHLVIADDYGHADELLARVGIERRAHGPSAHAAWYQGLDALPIVRPRGQHFLFFNVEQVVANHPGVLTGAGVPILAFDGGEELLVVEREVGRGAILAIADPSLFINQMLRRFYGNKQLAANVMRLYCESDPCHVKLLGPVATGAGDYRSATGPLGELPRLFDDAARHIDGLLGELSDLISRPPWAPLVAWAVLLIALALALYALAPGKRPARSPPLAGGLAAASPVVQEAVGLGASRAEADFHHLARALVARIDQLRGAGFLPGAAGSTRHGGRRSLRRLSEAELRARMDEMTRRALLRIDDEAASLQAAEPPMVSAERFVRLYDDVRLVLRFVEDTSSAATKKRIRQRSTARQETHAPA